jgi:hypothetical protein
MQFVFLRHSLVRFSGIPNSILKLVAFGREELGDRISAGCPFAAEIIHDLTDLVFVATRPPARRAQIFGAPVKSALVIHNPVIDTSMQLNTP